jgi:hypothetical protein
MILFHKRPFEYCEADIQDDEEKLEERKGWGLRRRALTSSNPYRAAGA